MTKHLEDFCLIDEAVVPGQMERPGRNLAARGGGIHWYGNARLEKSFTPERLEALRETGLPGRRQPVSAPSVSGTAREQTSDLRSILNGKQAEAPRRVPAPAPESSCPPPSWPS